MLIVWPLWNSDAQIGEQLLLTLQSFAADHWPLANVTLMATEVSDEAGTMRNSLVNGSDGTIVLPVLSTEQAVRYSATWYDLESNAAYIGRPLP